MRSEELQRLAWESEDAGKDVYVQRNEEYDEVIEFVEVDGVEYLNEEYEDEISDAYWTEDAYRVADSYRW